MHLDGSDQQRVLWADVCLDILECCDGGMQQVIENRHDHRILGSEMARKVRWRYIGGSSDLIDGRGVIPLGRAEIQSGIDQPLAAVLMPIFRDLCSLP
jgi:hypothetical protein